MSKTKISGAFLLAASLFACSDKSGLSLISNANAEENPVEMKTVFAVYCDQKSHGAWALSAELTESLSNDTIFIRKSDSTKNFHLKTNSIISVSAPTFSSDEGRICVTITASVPK